MMKLKVFSFSAVFYFHQYLTSISRFYKNLGDFTWRVSDCEELVGVTQTRRKKMY